MRENAHGSIARREVLGLLGLGGLGVVAAACGAGDILADDQPDGVGTDSSLADGGSNAPDGGPPDSGTNEETADATIAGIDGEPDGTQPQPPELPSLPQSQVDDALGKPLTRYDHSSMGGAGTNCGWFGPASTCLAIAAFSGNATADSRLVEQLHDWTSGGRAPTFMGGYRTQHELHLIATTLIASRTPHIWDELSAAERTRLDLCLKANLVCNAFVASDKNPFVLAGTQQRDLRGGTNLSRSWGPNYRCAMMMAPVLSTIWLGGAAAAHAWLDSYSHAALRDQIDAAGNLEDLLATWEAAGTGDAPTAAQIEAALSGWTYFGTDLGQHETLLCDMVDFAFGRNVSAGLNDGAGVWDPCRAGGSYSGKIKSGAATLPNAGAMGMATELNSTDGGGPRSAMSYSVGGYRVFLDAMATMIVTGYLDRESAAIQAARDRIHIGVTDLRYKTEKGYDSYSKGGLCVVSANNEVWDSSVSDTWGLSYSFGLWTDLLEPYLDNAS